MPVFKPRNRLVNFRLSEEEFEKLRASCSLNGARSLSDFARMAVLRSVASCATEPPVEAEIAPVPRGEGRLGEIDQRMGALENRVGELLRLIDSLSGASSGAVALVSETSEGEVRQ